MTTRIFSVAKHTFSITLPENVWDSLQNYEPFAVNESDGKEIFSLQYAENIDTEGKKSVFVDSSDDDMPRIEVYRLNDDWLFEYSERKDSEICAKLLINKQFTKGKIYTDIHRLSNFAIDNAAMLMYAFCTVKLQTLEIHASVIEKDGKGFVFLGKSGTGKSTHSRMWLSAFDDTRLLNDDNPIIRIIDGNAFVFGSPWSGKTKCYNNRFAPVGGIVKLAQAPENVIKKLSSIEAYASLYTSVSGLKFKSDHADYMHKTIANLIETTDFYLLQCLPNEEAANVCYNFTKK